QYEDASAEIGQVIALVSGVRAARAEMNVPAGAKIPLLLRDDSGLPEWAESQREQIMQLARLESMAVLDGDPPKGSIQLVIDGASVALPLSGIIDVAQESARLEKELGRIAQEIGKIEAKLGNEKFLAKAPEHVVAEQQRRKSEAEAARDKLKQALARVAAL
ncbi:MAG: valine--tRNA ligase, partial [Rhodospirillaceae bacterium]|nr:valine--tRNA ligase [Rhodospirillaceae bacterium]